MTTPGLLRPASSSARPPRSGSRTVTVVPGILLRDQLDVAVMVLDDAADDGQAQARSRDGAADRVRRAEEPAERRLLLLARDADAGVLDHQPRVAVVAVGDEGDVPAAGGVLDRV